MTCRWLQSVGRPCCLGLAARPVRIHPTATNVKSPAQYPSDRVPIPLIIVLTPWLAPVTARELHCKGFPSLYSSCAARVSYAQAASSIAVPIRAARLNPVEIGRRSPPVGWFGRNSTLSSRQQANGFCDVPKHNSEPAILYLHLTIVGILPIVTSSKNDHRIGWLLWRLGQGIERIRYHGNYGSRCAHG